MEKLISNGGFCWEELQSADPARAIAFYRELVGWGTREWPLPGGVVYTLFGPEGDYVAGCQAHNPQETGSFQGWLSYVQVEDVDATAHMAAELGGSVLFAPHDIPEVGRCAVLKDPEGAVLALMRFLRPATEPVDPLGSFCWRELMSRDLKAAMSFYGQLLGWTYRADPPEGEPEYIHIVAGEQQVGGMLPITPQMGPAPAMWTPYLTVAAVDELAAKAPTLGGQVCVPPMDIPHVGRFCLVTDPAGGTLALITLLSREG